MELEKLKERFDDLPFEAILKTDLLRHGIAFTPEALRLCAQAKTKSYFIFSFDRAPQSSLSELEKFAAPEEIALSGGPYHLKRTIVSVRLNPKSPYTVSLRASLCNPGVLCLEKNGETLCDVNVLPRPEYYNRPLKNGKPVTDIAPTIEWGYLIYLTVFRLCQYWGKEEECQFCDINENYRQQKKERSYTSVKSPEDIVEALQIISDTDSAARAYTVTGGSVTSKLEGLSEAQFYARYAEAIESRFPKKWIGKAVVQALPIPEVKILKASGYQIYHPNYEVWDEKLFAQICPGKDRYVGRAEWIKRILDAAEIFGPENVIPNFVAGVEMAKPYGFTDVEEAISSTGEGLDFFMSRGVSPRFTIWCPEPLTTLGPINESPPLEYYLRLLQVYRDTHRKYKLPIPPGYGEAGVGKAVFSVSAFMDVL